MHVEPPYATVLVITLSVLVAAWLATALELWGRPSPRSLVWPCLIALVLRVGWWQVSAARPLCEDCRLYDEVAWNVAQGRGFTGGHAAVLLTGQPSPLGADAPEVGQGPLYAGLIAAVYALGAHDVDGQHAGVTTPGRHDPGLVTCLQALGSVGLVAGAGLVGGPLSAWIVALWWPLWVYPSLLLTETLFGALLVAAVVSRGATAGALGGLAALCRPEAVLLWPILAVRSGRRWWLVLVVAALTVTPWIIRNALVFHQFVPISAEGGDVLYEAARGWEEWRPTDPNLRYLAEQGGDYLGQTHELQRAAVQIIRANPLAYVRGMTDRAVAFSVSSQTSYGPVLSEPLTTARGWRLIAKVGLLGLNTVLLLGGVVGLARAGRWSMVATVVVIAAVHLVYYASPRFQVPLMPLAAIGWGRKGTP